MDSLRKRIWRIKAEVQWMLVVAVVVVQVLSKDRPLKSERKPTLGKRR